MLVCVLAALVNLDPGLIWVDKAGLLPARVDPVPVESLRLNRNFAGEYYGAFTAAAERYYYYYEPDILWNCFSSPNYKTNNFYIYYGPRARAEDRTITSLRFADPIVPDSVSALRNTYANYSSSRLNLPTMPQFSWVSNWTWVVENFDLGDWVLCHAGWSQAQADSIINPDGGQLGYAMLRELPSPGDTSSSDIEDAENFTGGWANYRPSSAETKLNEWLATLYPANPPTASLLTNNTLRLDRKQLTALDYASAMLDLKFELAYTECDLLDANYIRSRRAIASASQDQLAYDFFGAGYEISFSPQWAYSTNLVVSTNSTSSSRQLAEFSTSGDPSTNGNWSATMQIDLCVTFEELTNALCTSIIRDFIDEYIDDPTISSIMVYFDGQSLVTPVDFTQRTHAYQTGTINVFAFPKDRTSDTGVYLNLFETNAIASAIGEIGRAVRLRTSGAVLDYSPRWEDSFGFRMGIINRMTAYPLCGRWLENAQGVESAQEWQCPAGGDYYGTNGYNRLLQIQAIAAVEDAADKCARVAGHDIRDVAGYLSLPDSVLAACMAEPFNSRLQPIAGIVQDMIYWNVREDYIEIGNQYYYPGDLIRLGTIQATSGGTAGRMSELPEAHGFAERKVLLKIPLSFLNCRQQ